MAEAMKVSPSPTPDHQRALLARADEHAGLVGRHRDERVVAAQLVVGSADGLDQVAVVVVRDQVRHHLGVGLGGELGAVGREALAQLDLVLDDAVQHDVDAAGGVEVRVGVLLGHAAVGGPARVADAGGEPRRQWPRRRSSRRPRPRAGARGCRPRAPSRSRRSSSSERPAES